MLLRTQTTLLACVLLATATVATAHEDVDAGVYNNITETYYFFFDGQFVTKPLGEDLGNAAPLSDFGGNFPSTWASGIDAALFNANTEKYYFFRYVASADEWQFIEKPFGANEEFTAPASMDAFAANDFPAQCAVDAATYDAIGRIYYFLKTDGSFCSQDQGPTNPTLVRSAAFGTGYPTDFEVRAVASRIGTANTENIYFFFSSDTYVRKVLEGDAFSIKLDTRQNWPRWPAAHGEDVPSAQPIDLDLPEALFTDPTAVVAGQSSPLIKERLLDLINAADGEIVVQSYLFHDTEFNTALVNAHRRGVRVTVLIDDRSDNQTTNNQALPGRIDHFQFVEVPDGILHNKVGIFSKVRTTSGIVENIVLSSSMNLYPGAYRKFQDALIISDDAIYDGFMRQTRNVKVVDTETYIPSIPGSNDGMRAYFFPRTGGIDTAEEILNSLMNDQTLGDLASMTVKVNMGSWTTARADVTQKLREVADLPNGRVEIVASGWKDLVVESGANSVRDILTGGNVKFNFLRQPVNLNTHSKYMLVDVTYGKTPGTETRSKIVYAGSQNFTGAALRKNFESWTRIINDEIFEAYNSNFNEIWSLTSTAATGLENGSESPAGYALSEIYPNPFISEASFALTLSRAQHVRVSAYDLLGREVAVLHDGLLGTDTHRFILRSRDLPNGIYVVRVVGKRYAASRRAVLVR